MPATTRRAAKAAASSSVTEPLSGNDDKSQTPIAARLDAEMPIMEEPATDDIHIAILAMVKAVCETTALNEALITDIDFEAENDCITHHQALFNFDTNITDSAYRREHSLDKL